MRRKSQIVSFIIAITWLLVGVGFCFPQNISVDSLNKALIADAGLSSVDLESIRKGKVVTRLLPSTDKREVAVLGITRIDLPVGVVRESFRTAIRKQEKKTTLQSGSFGDPVDFEDIANLKMEEKDLRDLKDCRIKKCNVRLSASMIRRFSENIDWKKDSSRSEAEDLYRRILVEYVRDYLSHGDEALMEYEGKKKTVSLKAEQNSLKQNIFWLKRFSPELDSYLSDFPNSGREDITNTFRWSKIKFGLKPVVIISHTATYKEQDGDTSQIIIISKQIYSSRYIDSSLGFTALVSFPKEDGNFETYIIFANYSRASALASRLGGLARGLVEKEAKGKLKNILGDTRRGAALLIANQANSPETYHPAGYRELFTRNAGIIFGVSIFVLVVIVVIRNRRG